MRYWKTCYITCFIFVLIPLTLYGQEDVEQLQKLDKLMFSGRYFESKKITQKNINMIRLRHPISSVFSESDFSSLRRR